MADISHPDTPKLVKFSNESLRPITERLRLLKIDCDWFMSRWNDEINTIIQASDSSDTLNDGRSGQGVSTLTAGEIQVIRNIVNSFVNWYDGSPNGAIASIDTKLGKATVRSLPTS